MNLNKDIIESFVSLYERPYNAKVPPHLHEFFELVYIYNGKGILTIHNQDINVIQGDLLFYDVHTRHCLNGGKDLKAINIVINPTLFEASSTESEHLVDILTLTWFRSFSIDDHTFKSSVHFSGHIQRDIENMIKNMLCEYTEKDIGYERVIYGYLNVLFTYLFRQLKNETGIAIRNDMKGISQCVTDYIERNYNKKITLSELAKENYYQPAYFSTIFKECYGISPMRYINKKRIKQAIYQLTHTNETATSIMHDVGIHDRKHFYKLFKDETGTTPGHFRLEYKNTP